MKLLIFSDIHNDWKTLERILTVEADFYISAGDQVSWGRGLDKAGELLKTRGDKVWVLPGNHETASQIADLFRRAYLDLARPHRYLGHRLEAGNLELDVETDGVQRHLSAPVADLVETAAAALGQVVGTPLTLLDHQRHAVDRSGERTVAAYVELRAGDGTIAVHGASQDPDALTASIKAVVSAANRLAALTDRLAATGTAA